MKDHTPIITGIMPNASEADSLTHEQCQGATILWKEYSGKSIWITCSLITSDLDITAELKSYRSVFKQSSISSSDFATYL